MNLEPIGDPEAIEALEHEVMIALPDDVALARTRHSTIKPRRAWLWLFYSRSGFTLDPDALPYQVVYLAERDPEKVAEWIHSLMPRDKLPEPIGGSSMTWDTETYQFDVDLLKTTDGDFLSVERFTLN